MYYYYGYQRHILMQSVIKYMSDVYAVSSHIYVFSNSIVYDVFILCIYMTTTLFICGHQLLNPSVLDIQ